MVLNDADDTPETAIQSTQGGAAVPYQRRRPEETTLYQVVQEHVETFFAQVELETGAGLPQFVKAEVEAFLECGILAHGFLRLRCGTCTQDTLVAFACKRRGFCPACGARRMAETAAHLVDHVIPRVPSVNGSCRFPSRCAICSPQTPTCSRPCCRSSPGPSPPF